MLCIAKQTIETLVIEGKAYEPPLPESAALTQNGAAFVTLYKQGQLRGCIGHIIAIEPLYLSVRDNSIAAASEDPRFMPVSKEEYKNLDISLSVLSPLVPVNSISEISIGRDGLILERQPFKGVFLPQVPVECGWDLETYLEQLCYKAGMTDPQGWKAPETKLYRFTVEKI